jgi:hypothetical protein
MFNYEIPTVSGHPFTERVTVLGVTYSLYFCWNWVSKCWVLDLWDQTGTVPILRGIPIVTGCDLLEQFAYLSAAPVAVGRSILTAMTIGPGVPPDDVPTFTNLGKEGHLFISTP